MAEKLELNRLSESGEIVRKISCLAGRITVFRANSEAEYDLYRAALAGWQTKERISALLDGNSFAVQKACLIGFGESFASLQGDPSVAEYLSSVGMPSERIESELLEAGLGGLSGQRCKMLGPVQERILRLLAAIGTCPPVILLNEPFEQVADQWREKLGERLAAVTWSRKSIVVVARLSNRPECWVENEHIARVQLERPRKKTIGFGSDGSNINEMIGHLRAHSVAINRSTLPGAASITQRIKNKFLDSRIFGYGVVISAATIFCVGFAWYTSFERQSTSMPQPSGDTSSAAAELKEQPMHAVQDSSGLSLQPAALEISGQQRGGRNQFVLDGYPVSVKESILLAFNNPEALIEQLKNESISANQNSAVGSSESTQRSISALRSFGENMNSQNYAYAQPANEQTDSPFDEADLEARREEIRLRFLEAIQNAAPPAE